MNNIIKHEIHFLSHKIFFTPLQSTPLLILNSFSSCPPQDRPTSHSLSFYPKPKCLVKNTLIQHEPHFLALKLFFTSLQRTSLLILNSFSSCPPQDRPTSLSLPFHPNQSKIKTQFFHQILDQIMFLSDFTHSTQISHSSFRVKNL